MWGGKRGRDGELVWVSTRPAQHEHHRKVGGHVLLIDGSFPPAAQTFLSGLSLWLLVICYLLTNIPPRIRSPALTLLARLDRILEMTPVQLIRQTVIELRQPFLGGTRRARREHPSFRHLVRFASCSWDLGCR
jgi:hypothetical protein